jgi:hypothetical protein
MAHTDAWLGSTVIQLILSGIENMQVQVIGRVGSDAVDQFTSKLIKVITIAG